jgi:hypothetical protein
MKRFIEGQDRGQGSLLPEHLDDCVAEDNPVRVVDVFVDELDLARLGFGRVRPAKTGRPAYHPAVLLKLYIYGYLNRIQSSRRLEREAQRNVELMRLTRRTMTAIADRATSRARKSWSVIKPASLPWCRRRRRPTPRKVAPSLRQTATRHSALLNWPWPPCWRPQSSVLCFSTAWAGCGRPVHASFDSNETLRQQ